VPARRIGSIRIWQTSLFIIVIVVAMLILSGSLSAGLQSVLSRMAETNELRNASALAQRLGPEFPVQESGLGQVRAVVADYRGIYGGGIWIYDTHGELVESAYEVTPMAAALEAAQLGALKGRSSYASSDLRPNGWVIASKAFTGRTGQVEGVVVTASVPDQQIAILHAVRDRLWTTFWFSLVIAGLLGFGFAEIVGRRIRVMSAAAKSMEAGQFDQRLPTGIVPDEIQELAESYNRMAIRLGDAFEALTESRSQIAAVVESMAEGVLALDSEGVIRAINPEAIRLLAPSIEPLGSFIDDIGPDPAVRELLRTGLSGERQAKTIPLGQRVVLCNCAPMLEPGGAVEGAVLLLADVTEQHRIEDAQRRFVADASHEMRTPIAAIKGMLELLDDGAKEVPAVRDDFISTMQFEVDRLGRLVSDLLTLAQLEAGSLRVTPAPAFAADLLGNVANVMQTLADQAGVALAVELPDESLRVLADRDRITQVLLSFTDNALKHAPESSTVHLRARAAEEGLVRFEVTDEGEGISGEEIERVFERFYRADTARAGSGTGLGLAIAKEIVEAHGSTIDVSSETGAGTTFGFSLPAA
jgi:signal transduction histidine kinase